MLRRPRLLLRHLRPRVLLGLCRHLLRRPRVLLGLRGKPCRFRLATPQGLLSWRLLLLWRAHWRLLWCRRATPHLLLRVLPLILTLLAYPVGLSRWLLLWLLLRLAPGLLRLPTHPRLLSLLRWLRLLLRLTTPCRCAAPAAAGFAEAARDGSGWAASTSPSLVSRNCGNC